MPRTLHPGQGSQLDIDADEIADPEGNDPYPAPASPGGPGTLVADPPELAPDLVAAMGAANGPDAGNPLATMADVGGLLVVTRTLTAAEVQTLNSDPIDLVPAAAGRLYWPVEGIVVYHPGAIPFDISTVSLLAIGSQFTLLMSIDMTLGFLAGAEAFAIAIPLAAATNLALPDSTNEALRFSADDDMPDGDGTLDVTVVYRAVDVS